MAYHVYLDVGAIIFNIFLTLILVIDILHRLLLFLHLYTDGLEVLGMCCKQQCDGYDIGHGKYEGHVDQSLEWTHVLVVEQAPEVGLDHVANVEDD